MSNTLTKFDFKGNGVRIVTIDGAPWFVAADVLFAFGHGQDAHGSIMRKLDPDQSTLHRLQNAPRSQRIISESGLYKLVLRSDKPQARQFQDWVTREVLPAIRKDGGYILGEEKVRSGEMSEDELVFRAMEVMKRKIDRLAAENAAMKHELEVLSVDEYRAIHRHAYLSHAHKTMLGKAAADYCRASDIRIEKQERTFRDGLGRERVARIGVYPKAALDHAWTSIGLQ